MIVRPSARARGDAFRAAMAAEFAEAVLACSRSLRQMIVAGHPYAMIPAALASPQVLRYALDELDERYGAADGRFGNLCAAVLPAGDVRFVCLRSWCPGRHDEGGLHGWPPAGPAGRAVAALAEQTDPVARIERRALMAIEGSAAFPHLAGMPSA